MKKSESVAKLAEALSKAQALIGSAAMDGKNPHFNSKYSTLAAVMDASKPMHQFGLSVVQTAEVVPGEAGSRVEVTSILMHSSGEWIESSISLKPRLDDPQAVGSAITYGRRYSLAAMVGIASDDDDGNAASAGKPKPAPKPMTDSEMRQNFNVSKESVSKAQVTQSTEFAVCLTCGFIAEYLPGKAPSQCKCGKSQVLGHTARSANDLAMSIKSAKPVASPETTLPATKSVQKGNPIDVPTVRRINGLLGALKVDGAEAKHGAVAAIVGHEFTVPADLTMDEGLAVIKSLEGDLARKEAAK